MYKGNFECPKINSERQTRESRRQGQVLESGGQCVSTRGDTKKEQLVFYLFQVSQRWSSLPSLHVLGSSLLLCDDLFFIDQEQTPYSLNGSIPHSPQSHSALATRPTTSTPSSPPTSPTATASPPPSPSTFLAAPSPHPTCHHPSSSP